MKPHIGGIVHYVQNRPEGHGEGVMCLPAIIVAVWGDTCVNLQVFTDGANSEEAEETGEANVKWATSAILDESDTAQPNTWHWTKDCRA